MPTAGKGLAQGLLLEGLAGVAGPGMGLGAWCGVEEGGGA